MAQRQMHLMAYLKTGASYMHPGGWRHPAAELDDIFSPSRYAHIARVLEKGFFDGCFYADASGVPDLYEGRFDAYINHGGQMSYLDPMLVLPIMAAATSHLGLGCTLSTTFHKPFHIARAMATLDHLSGGRACWNIVTSSNDFEARNFGLDELPDKNLRYDLADEVLEACTALWSCWDADALVMDKKSGRFADAAKVRYADYEGQHVRTRGPLPMPRSPQGRPVFLQAGASPRGRDFAAKWAEAIFSAAEGVESCVEFYTDIKSRMGQQGRAPEGCAVLPWISVCVGETEAIARERAMYLNSLTNDELVLATNSTMLGADLSKTRTESDLDAHKGNQGHGGLEDNVRRVMREEGISFEEASRRAQGLLVGTPVTIADYMQEVFEARGCDGFVLLGNVAPGMFEDFCRMVVPELQSRGLMRTAYTGTTMRENLLGIADAA